MAAPYIVNGAEEGMHVRRVLRSGHSCWSQGTYPRLDIATLIQDEYQFSLFIQAMSHLQTEGYKPDPASWQEIGV